MRNHGESEGKRRADGSENMVRDGRRVREFQTGWNSQGRKKRRFICHRQISLFLLRNNEDEIRNPPPFPCVEPTTHHHLSTDLCQHLPSLWSLEMRMQPMLRFILYTRNYVCPRGRAHWLPLPNAWQHRQPIAWSQIWSHVLNDQLLKCADKLRGNISTRAIFLFQSSGERPKVQKMLFLVCPLRWIGRQNADNALLCASHT